MAKLISPAQLDKLYDADRQLLTVENFADHINGQYSLPKLLWHYASPAAMLGLIQNQEVWASDIFYMNDAQEVLYGVNFVYDEIEAYRKENPTDNKFVAAMRQQALTGFNSRRTATKVFTSRRFFSTSLCTDGDDLNLWRGYADKGVGFSVGFEAKKLVNESARGMMLELLPIIYDAGLQRSLVRKILSSHEKLATKHRFAQNLSAPARKRFYAHLIASLIELIFYFKNPSFSGEKEWRLLYWGVKRDIRKGELEVAFRPTTRTIVPYVKLGLRHLVEQKAGLLPIAEIVTGPQIESRLSRDAIYELLRSAGYSFESVRVRPSRVPFPAL